MRDFPHKLFLSRWLQRAVLLTSIVTFAACLSVVAQEGEEEESQPRTVFEPRAVEIEFTDGSLLRLHLADELIEMDSPHGKLKIPAEDVLRIEFAQRLPEETKKQIDDLLAALREEDEDTRANAGEGLLAFREKAYLPLVKAAKSGDPALAPIAGEVLQELKAQVSAEDLQVREDDLIVTSDTKIAGLISMPALKVKTSQFGELSMKLVDARSLRHQSLAAAEPEQETDQGVLPDPGNLKAYEGRIGETFSFSVTGSAAGGSIWGTDIYTTDSRLNMAAVHAGAVKDGETGVVKIKIVAGQPSYAGSARNGVTSSGYGGYGGSYEILKGGGGVGPRPGGKFRGPRGRK
jgi:hypothetical protein